jgi:hypothetical protein
MHDVHGKTIDMMKKILPTLKAEGYKFAKLTDVPSVKRAIGSLTIPPAADDSCASSTLGRNVPENTCVQSRSNSKWFRCSDKEWLGIAGPTDVKCTGAKFPLSP